MALLQTAQLTAILTETILQQASAALLALTMLLVLLLVLGFTA